MREDYAIVVDVVTSIIIADLVVCIVIEVTDVDVGCVLRGVF